jgi:guanine nucleotide-binding protein subunit alpha
VWKDSIVTELLNKEGGEFYLMDSAPYFFDHAKRIGHPDYVPDVQDVLRARSKTTGIMESHFNLGQLHIQ